MALTKIPVMDPNRVYERRDDPRFYDAPLSNAGISQAQANSAEVMARVPADIVFTSPLVRAVETA